MSHSARARMTGAPVAAAPARIGARMAAGSRALLDEVALAWRHAVARREFERIDEHTLRDLGIARGEFDSYWAEAHGLAPRTRRRLMEIDSA